MSRLPLVHEDASPDAWPDAALYAQAGVAAAMLSFSRRDL